MPSADWSPRPWPLFFCRPTRTGPQAGPPDPPALPALRPRRPNRRPRRPNRRPRPPPAAETRASRTGAGAAPTAGTARLNARPARPPLGRVKAHSRARPGRQHFCEVSVFRLQWSLGKILGVAVTAVDVSDREKGLARARVLNAVRQEVGRSLDVVVACQELVEALVPSFGDVMVVEVVDAVVRGDDPRCPLTPGVPLRCAACGNSSGGGEGRNRRATCAAFPPLLRTRRRCRTGGREWSRWTATCHGSAPTRTRHRRSVSGEPHTLLTAPLAVRGTGPGGGTWSRLCVESVPGAWSCRPGWRPIARRSRDGASVDGVSDWHGPGRRFDSVGGPHCLGRPVGASAGQGSLNLPTEPPSHITAPAARRIFPCNAGVLVVRTRDHRLHKRAAEAPRGRNGYDAEVIQRPPESAIARRRVGRNGGRHRPA